MRHLLGGLEVAVAPKLDYGAELKLHLWLPDDHPKCPATSAMAGLTRRPDRARLGRGVDACVEIKLQAPHGVVPELHLLDGVTQLTD